MKKILFLIVILIYSPVFAACPIDGESCTAEFQPEPLALPPLAVPQAQAPSKLFTGTQSSMDLSREIKPVKIRDFGSNNTEYGYNSSCQFGVCMDAGTPKSFKNAPE